MATDAEELHKKRFRWGRCPHCGGPNWYSTPVIAPPSRLSAERMAELDHLYGRNNGSVTR